MKIIIALDELPICASRRDPDSTIRKYSTGLLKKMPQASKASKIQIEFDEEDGGKLQIFAKPHFMALDMLDDKDVCFVGAPGLYSRAEFSEEEHEKISMALENYKCYTVFEERTAYSDILEEILKRNTYESVQKNLDHIQLFEKYRKYNEKYYEKIMEIYEEGDVVWIMDHALLLLPQMLADIAVGISFTTSFSTLFKCIPFWDKLLLSILHSRYIEFMDKSSKESFELLISQKTGFLVSDTPYKDIKLPLVGFNRKGIDKKAILGISDKIKADKAGNEVMILLPFDSPMHLLGVEAYLSKYGTDITIMFLGSRIGNPERHAEVSRLREYLEMNYKITTKPLAPFNDAEFYSELKKCGICYCPDVADICSFLEIPVIQSNPYDFTEVAKEIKDKIGTKGSSAVDRLVSCCNATDTELPSKMEWKKHFVTHLLLASNIKAEIDVEEKEFKMRNSLDIDSTPNRREVGVEGQKKPTSRKESHPKKEMIRIDVDDEKNKMVLEIVENFKKSKVRTLVLDYDGTLTDIVQHPEMAIPTQEIKDLLVNLSKVCRVMICTGRSIKDSDAFFPKEIEVFGEHGACHRVNGKWTEKSTFELKELSWKIADFFRQRTPKSELENKKTGYTFHYRNASPLIATKQARALFELLKRVCGDNVEEGNHIVEVRSSKKSVAMDTVEEGFVLCAGDDVADEDMLSVCKGYTIKIGNPKKTVADYVIKDPQSFRKLLKKLLE